MSKYARNRGCGVLTAVDVAPEVGGGRHLPHVAHGRCGQAALRLVAAVTEAGAAGGLLLYADLGALVHGDARDDAVGAVLEKLARRQLEVRDVLPCTGGRVV